MLAVHNPNPQRACSGNEIGMIADYAWANLCSSCVHVFVSYRHIKVLGYKDIACKIFIPRSATSGPQPFSNLFRILTNLTSHSRLAHTL